MPSNKPIARCQVTPLKRRRPNPGWVLPAQLHREIGEAFRRWQAGRGYRRDPHS